MPMPRDQFAGAEGRMKWAPNKKLHFEIAVIKAIQTLAQVTLNEVIENLSALRDGKTPTTSARSRDTPVASAGASAPVSIAVPKISAPRAAETPAPAGEEKTATEVATPTDGPLDPEELWQKAVAQISARRPLIKGWIDSAKVLGQEGRNLLLGFPPEQKTAMESIATPRNKDFLESVLKEISGRDLSLKFSLKEGLLARTPNHAEIDAAPPRKQTSESAETFKNDPLIREALEIFKGEIKT